MRAFWSGVVGITAAVFFGSLACLVWPISPGGTLGMKVMRAWGRFVLFFTGVKLTVSGGDRQAPTPCVIVCNHASMLDICACAAAIPADFRFVSRPFFFKLPFLGWGMRLSGHISLDPKNPREASKVLKTLDAKVESGTTICLYPEGTRSPDGTLQRYRRGPFMVAIRTQAPVLPVHLRGTADRLPKGEFTVRPGPLHVTIGEPVPTAGLAEKDARAFAQRIEDWTRAQEQA